MKRFFCVGTYTEPILFGTGEVLNGRGNGIYLCAFEDGKISIIETVHLRNPSYFCFNEKNKKIYAVNELKEYLGRHGGGITQIDYDLKGNLTVQNTYNIGGADPCHVACSPDFSCCSIANFASGSITIVPLNKEGNMLDSHLNFQHKGSSVHPIRQKAPHAHSSIFFNHRKKFLVPDLGTDTVVSYEYSSEGVFQRDHNSISLPAGSGPRFGEITPDDHDFYLVNELNSTITHFVVQNDSLISQNTVSTLPQDYSGTNICSDLHISPNQKYLYATNRGHDSIACYRLTENRKLQFIQRVSSRGRTPRNFAIDPAGKFLIVGNQDSDNIVVFSIENNGRLHFCAEYQMPTPVCIRFFSYTNFDI